MNAVVIEHVKISELPEHWRAKLPVAADARVTVRIEEEVPAVSAEEIGAFVSNDPAFGIWRDHEQSKDVEGYLRKLRAPRYNRDGSSNER